MSQARLGGDPGDAEAVLSHRAWTFYVTGGAVVQAQFLFDESNPVGFNHDGTRSLLSAWLTPQEASAVEGYLTSQGCHVLGGPSDPATAWTTGRKVDDAESAARLLETLDDRLRRDRGPTQG